MNNIYGNICTTYVQQKREINEGREVTLARAIRKETIVELEQRATEVAQELNMALGQQSKNTKYIERLQQILANLQGTLRSVQR